jgi:NSS family neurotransmitter:Na+ symporter
MAGENGGGAFVLVYLLCIALIGVPIMMAEIMIGRHAQKNPVAAFRTLAADLGASPAWSLVGWMGVLTGFLILSFYSVVAGWAFAYVWKAAAGDFVNLGASQSAAQFAGLLASPWQLLAWHSVFMLLCWLVVVRGVRGGIEWAVRWMMPVLLLLLLALVAYAAWLGDFADGLRFLLRPQFSDLTRTSVLMALGQAFFTLSLGMGAIMVYGSYLSPRESIGGLTFAIIGVDTVVALLAGVAIFPIVFAIGLEPQAGPGLVFQTLPYVFGQMPAGSLFGFLFFLLIVFAALTSGISLLEPATAYLVESRSWSRNKAAGMLALVVWLIGIASVLSFNHWSGVYPLGFIEALDGKSTFDLLDGLTSNILLPLGGLGIALFAGWKLDAAVTAGELRLGRAYGSWRFLIRYVSPVLVGLVLLNSLGILRV